MPSYKDLAILSQRIYDATAEDWDHLFDSCGVVVGVKSVEGVDVIAFRGSKTAEDWIDDIRIWPSWHKLLGFCHSGFIDGIDEVFQELAAKAGERVIFTGHSLGGARARLQAAHFIASGRKVEGVVVFGSPRPAFSKVKGILLGSGADLMSFRNCDDPVPLVPSLLGLYQHPDDWKPVVGVRDFINPVKDHGIENYIEALSKMAV